MRASAAAPDFDAARWRERRVGAGRSAAMLSAPEHAVLDELAGDVDLGWLQLRPGLDVLEIGCGTGAVTRRVAHAIAPGRAIGLDNDPAALRVARHAARAENVSNVDFKRAELADLSSYTESFDVVYTRSVLMYAIDPVNALRQQRRATKPRGLVAALAEGDWGTAVVHPATGVVSNAVGKLQEAIRFAGGDPWIGRRLLEIFRAAGFVDVAVSDVGRGDAVVTGATLTAPGWTRALAGMIERLEGHAVPGRDLAAEVRTWASHPGAILVWPRVFRARARL